MTKKELKSIIHLLSKDNKKIRKELKELKEKAGKIDAINEVVCKWYKQDGIETGDQGMQAINDILEGGW